MKDITGFFFYWGPFLLYATLILTLSSMSQPVAAPEVSDKWLHAGEYSLFALLLQRALSKNIPAPISWKEAGAVCVAGGLFGATDEYYQSFVPGRVSSIYDWYADVAGILGMITFLLVWKSFARRAAQA